MIEAFQPDWRPKTSTRASTSTSTSTSTSRRGYALQAPDMERPVKPETTLHVALLPV
jgi:hypothetical protein